MQELDPHAPKTLSEGRYTLLGILGEGSMGRTYLADSEAGKVAIKALYPSRLATAKDLELFVREAQVLQKLSHPRIPSYIDAFDEGEGEGVRYHLVQQWVEGATLREMMARGDRFDEQSAGQLMRQLLEILTYMHGCDPPVVHRDLKPDNIIVRATDGEPVLVDFGAVREVVRLTMGGGSTIVGTYGYMPPEQLMGRALPASDLYSLGVSIVEMLTRQTPEDLHGQDVKRLIGEANVGEPFRRVLRRLCAPALSDRYVSGDDVLKDLDAALGGGALVHAGSIEAAIQRREKDEELALKKASTPGIAHMGYITLIVLATSAALAALAFVAQTLATSFEGAFLAAGVVSVTGMMITLGLVSLRYVHDAWEPPDKNWGKSRGRVLSTSRVVVGESQYATHVQVEFAFKTVRGEHKSHFSPGTDRTETDYPIGAEFDVYYRRDNPAYHEVEDFVRDPDHVMTRLFSAAQTHTPE